MSKQAVIISKSNFSILMPVSLTVFILFSQKKEKKNLLAINKPTDSEFYLQPFFSGINKTSIILQNTYYKSKKKKKKLFWGKMVKQKSLY